METFLADVDPQQPKIAVRTSDRILRRRCRRKWAWASPLMQGRRALEPADYFWFGTGMHFALEDYHGYNHYLHPATSFRAYVESHKTLSKVSGRSYLPDTWKELEILGIGMMTYYADYWLRNRSPLRTYIDPRTGHPQCEVRFEIPLPVRGPNDEIVVYQGTLDRVTEQEYGGLAILDYKSAKVYQLAHLEIDDQITSYMWAGSVLYPSKTVEEFIYQQHKKTLPVLPKVLGSGRVSVDKKQHTVASLYRDTLISVYGNMNYVPSENVNFLNSLLGREEEDGDPFVKRDYVSRTEHQIAAQGEKIMMEVEEMLDPRFRLYPNPTKDCSWDCSFMQACIAVDGGEDYEQILDSLTVARNAGEDDSWRNHLPQQLEYQEQPEIFREIAESLEKFQDSLQDPTQAQLQALDWAR